MYMYMYVCEKVKVCPDKPVIPRWLASSVLQGLHTLPLWNNARLYTHVDRDSLPCVLHTQNTVSDHTLYVGTCSNKALMELQKWSMTGGGGGWW